VLHLASDALPTSLVWLARTPDVVIILLCCLGACLAALPVARATGLVGLLAAHERRLIAQLDELARACSALAPGNTGPSTAAAGQDVPARFRPAFAVLAALLGRKLPPHETFAAASAAMDEWLEGRSAGRRAMLAFCRTGPAVSLGTALGTVLLMAEVWANPAALSSGAALGIGLLVMTCVLSLSVLSWAANWLEEAERADQLAAGVVLESARMIAAGGSAADVSTRAEMILRPRTPSAEVQRVRKAA